MTSSPTIPDDIMQAAEGIADVILKAAGSGFRYYMPSSKERIIAAAAEFIVSDRQRSHWQDISSAKHGVLHLLYEPHDEGGFIFVGACNGAWFNNLDQRIQHPTHWMPLPPDPTGEIA